MIPCLLPHCDCPSGTCHRTEAHRLSVEPITATVKTFCRLSGLGKTKVFQMMADGTLDTIKLGTRRLIVIASYQRYIDDQLSMVQSMSRNRDAV
jgi:hypothetical protein